jgi:hypothetical protein
MRFPYIGLGRGIPSQVERTQILEQANLRGSTAKLPDSPREVVGQSAPRGVLVTWALPAGDSSSITGWRVYSGNEMNLQQVIGDRGTRQAIIPVTAGEMQNVMISAVDARGNESAKILVQAQAITESGAPALPSAPVDFDQGSGLDKESGGSSRTRALV